MTIAGGTLIIFQFGGELYPTEVRGVGIGLASFLGGIALTIIPFINYLVSTASSEPLAGSKMAAARGRSSQRARIGWAAFI